MHNMMTSSNGTFSRVTGPLCGEFTGHRWIPRTKTSDAELWCFLGAAPWIYDWLKQSRGWWSGMPSRSYDVIVMKLWGAYKWSFVFQGHLSTFKLTRAIELAVWPRFHGIRMIITVWFHKELWNSRQHGSTKDQWAGRSYQISPLMTCRLFGVK